jgi:hypothetical protein
MKTTISVRLLDSDRAALESLSESSGESVSDLIRHAIDNLVLETQMNGGELFLISKTDSGKRFIAEQTLRALTAKHGDLNSVPRGHPLADTVILKGKVPAKSAALHRRADEAERVTKGFPKQ